MSFYKCVKELATKVALSPIANNRSSITIPSQRLSKREHLPSTPQRPSSPWSPQILVQSDGTKTVFHQSSPNQKFLSPEASTTQKCTNELNATFSPKFGCKLTVGSPLNSPFGSDSYVEVNTPLRQDLLRKPKLKRRLKVLGKGAFGRVFIGRLKGRKVAVKVSQKQTSTDTGEWNCLLLNHPHIVCILNITENISHSVTVMEYAGSRNLQQILDSTQFELSVPTIFRYSHQVASAVHYCHQKCILHLDIKPANVVVSSAGCCKLCDFGCSKKMAEECKTRMPHDTTLQGTVAYIAPELLRGLPSSAAADTYSLGILYWQLLTRKNPFEGEDPHAVIYKVVAQNARPPLPPSTGDKLSRYVNLIQSCWDPRPDRRQNLKEIVQQLDVQF